MATPRPSLFVLLAAAGLISAAATSACTLTGIEPDEIDIADASEGGLSTGLPGGDGDGDQEGTDGAESTDGDPSTTGGDSGGDGDGDGAVDESCTGFAPADLNVGDNPVQVAAGASALMPSCGGLGPERVLRFVAPSEGEWTFTATSAELAPILALVRACEPLDELACATAEQVLVQPLLAGEVVFVILDSAADTGGGAATVTVTAP